MKTKISIFWFRRDLRLSDNTGFYHALNGENPVLPIFIFDSQILDSIDISKSISDIDLKIEDSTQLQLATDEIILVFNSNPKSQEFTSSQIKIGREVLGFDSNVFSVF